MVTLLPFPGTQLSTDDFDGPLYNATNLAVKGIASIAAYGYIVENYSGRDRSLHRGVGVCMDPVRCDAVNAAVFRFSVSLNVLCYVCCCCSLRHLGHSCHLLLALCTLLCIGDGAGNKTAAELAYTTAAEYDVTLACVCLGGTQPPCSTTNKVALFHGVAVWLFTLSGMRRSWWTSRGW